MIETRRRSAAAAARQLGIPFCPVRLLILCLFIQGWFVILHLHLALHKNPGVGILGQAFDLLREASLPTSFAFLQAVAVAAVAALVATLLRREGVAANARVGWLFAATLFAVIAIDDAAGFHERLGAITSLELMTNLGYPSYPWHISIAPILGGWLLLTVYLLWRDLGAVPWCRPAVVAAVGCYGFSQGIDVVEGIDRMSKGALGSPAASLPALMMLEEVLEMVGTALFLFAFATILKARLAGVTLALAAEDVAAERPVLGDMPAPAGAQETG